MKPATKSSGLSLSLAERFSCRQDAVRAVRFNTDGQYCLTGGSDKSIRLWNPYQGTLLKTYTGHGLEVADVQSSGDNSQLCSCSADRQVLIWDVSTGDALRRLRFHAARVNTVRYNGMESSVVVSGGLDGRAAVWDCRSRQHTPIQVMDEAKDSVTSVFIFNWLIVTGSLDAHIRHYDIRKGELKTDYVGHPVTSVSLTRDGQCVLASCQDSKLRLFDLATGELLNQYTGHKNTQYKIDSCILGEDAHIASGSEDGTGVHLWDLVTTTRALTLPHRGASVVHSLSPHPSSNALLTATTDTVFLWHPPSESDEEDSKDPIVGPKPK